MQSLPIDWPTLLALIPLTFLVAAAYSSVGLGGGTGYLAIMTLLGVPSENLASTALLLNIVVTATALLRYGIAGRIDLTLFMPFLLPAVPLSFVAGLWAVHGRLFDAILAVVLVVVALATAYSARSQEATSRPRPSHLWTVGPLTGGLVGFVSGLLGVGGGVFLGPIVLLLRWAGPKEVAAMNSLFILVVSLAGLMAHGIRGSISLCLVVPLVISVLLGGLLGSHLGETRLSARALKRIFAVIILVAAIRAGFRAFGVF